MVHMGFAGHFGVIIINKHNIYNPYKKRYDKQFIHESMRIKFMPMPCNLAGLSEEWYDRDQTKQHELKWQQMSNVRATHHNQR